MHRLISPETWKRGVLVGAVLCLAFGAARASILLAYPELIQDGPAGTIAIVKGHGLAPDQYRYLPHLLLWSFLSVLTYKQAITVFVFGWLAVSLAIIKFLAWPSRPPVEKTLVCIFIALIYPLSMPFGARFDTSIQLALVISGLYFWDRPFSYFLIILLCAVTRADYAFALALIVLLDAIQEGRKLPVYVAAVAAPLVVQTAMATHFSGNAYYANVITLPANLSGEIFQAPGFWFCAAIVAFIAVERPTSSIMSGQRQGTLVLKWGVLLLYLASVVAIGRLREWRLMLPILPLVLNIYFGPANGRNKDALR